MIQRYTDIQKKSKLKYFRTTNLIQMKQQIKRNSREHVVFFTNNLKSTIRCTSNDIIIDQSIVTSYVATNFAFTIFCVKRTTGYKKNQDTHNIERDQNSL